MSYDTAQSVTLPEWEGLSKEILTRLTGNKGQFWLRALHKFCRGESGFVRRKRWYKKVVQSVPFEHPVRELKKLSIDVFHALTGAKEAIDAVPFPAEPFDVVEVRFEDLVEPDKEDGLTYEKLLEIALEYGLEPCDVPAGLLASVRIIQKMDEKDKSGDKSNILICSEPLIDNGVPRIPLVWANRLSTKQDANRGGATMRDVRPSSVPMTGCFCRGTSLIFAQSL